MAVKQRILKGEIRGRELRSKGSSSDPNLHPLILTFKIHGFTAIQQGSQENLDCDYILSCNRSPIVYSQDHFEGQSHFFLSLDTRVLLIFFQDSGD